MEWNWCGRAGQGSSSCITGVCLHFDLGGGIIGIIDLGELGPGDCGHPHRHREKSGQPGLGRTNHLFFLFIFFAIAFLFLFLLLGFLSHYISVTRSYREKKDCQEQIGSEQDRCFNMIRYGRLGKKQTCKKWNRRTKERGRSRDSDLVICLLGCYISYIHPLPPPGHVRTINLHTLEMTCYCGKHKRKPATPCISRLNQNSADRSNLNKRKRQYGIHFQM